MNGHKRNENDQFFGPLLSLLLKKQKCFDSEWPQNRVKKATYKNIALARRAISANHGGSVNIHWTIGRLSSHLVEQNCLKTKLTRLEPREKGIQQAARQRVRQRIRIHF